MLPKEIRATTTQIREALKNGKTHHSDNFSIRIAPSSTSSTSVAVVVPKKVVATAAERNALKRSVKGVLASFMLPGNKIVVIYVKKGAVKLSPHIIRNELSALLT
jgi:ribonuclease P protein component